MRWTRRELLSRLAGGGVALALPVATENSECSEKSRVLAWPAVVVPQNLIGANSLLVSNVWR
jgi:hypothetical protein